MVTQCQLYREDFTHMVTPYRVQSSISTDVVTLFLRAVQGLDIPITKQNFEPLGALSREFGFHGLDAKLSAFQNLPEFRNFVDDEARSRISALEEQAVHQADYIAALEDKVRRLEQTVARLEGLALPAGGIPLDSQICPNLPPIFEEFRGKQFSLLYRASRDGFQAKAFHSRCDGRPNTLTLIHSKNGNIFGGFTPCEWESPAYGCTYKYDEAGRSFLFTVKNPHGIAPRKFELRPEQKRQAIYCGLVSGPGFGTPDIYISDNCGTSVSKTDGFGKSYVNDTGISGQNVFTGEGRFTVRELEVFEISD
jgi:hypothetical protein